MKFFISRDLRDNRPLVWMLNGFLLLQLLYVVTHAVALAHGTGLDAAEVTSAIVGDPVLFLDPKPLVGMVEELHGELFVGTIMLMTVLALFFRLNRSETLNLVAVVVLMGSFVLLEAAPFGVHYRIVGAEWIYLGAYWLFHIGLLTAVVTAAVFLNRPRSRHEH